MSEKTRTDSRELEELRTQASDLHARVEALRAELTGFRSTAKFNGDDSAFLIWVLGFTAGANLERGGDQGQVIFARCRDIYMKGFPGAGTIGGNPS